MPPVDAEYLLAYLFELGPTMAAGMGAGPITQQELAAWQVNTGIALTPWEARTLRRLSLDYLAAMRDAESPDCPAPWNDKDLRARLAAQTMKRSIERLADL